MKEVKRPFVKSPEPIKCEPVKITPARDVTVFTFGEIAKIINRFPAETNGKSLQSKSYYVVIFTPDGETHEIMAMSLSHALSSIKCTIPESIFEQGFKVG